MCAPASMTMRSPSATNAIGPPSTASGATCPTQKPCVPPENRPSVMSAASAPRPGALHRAGDREHLAHARAALRALVADDDDVAGLDLAREDLLHRRALTVEDARACRRSTSSSMPATFTTAPLGASEPRRIAMPPCAWIGWSSGYTTRPSGAGGSRSARFSAIVLPVTVRQSPWSRPASSSIFMHDGHAADRVEVDHVELAVRLHVGDVRDPRADAVEVVELELDARLVARSRGGAAPRSSSRRAPS